jgi:hypothetical protein
MRTYALFALVFTVAACSADQFHDGDQPDAGDAAPNPNPVGGDGGVSGDNAIYVSSSKGSATGDGTKAHPFASLDAGIAAAKGRPVYACAETYVEPVHFLNGVSVSGDYDCNAAWTKTTAHARVAPPASPAVFASNITSPTRVEFVDIFASDFTDQSQSSIALLASGSPGLTIANAIIHAGAGGKGADGTNATAPVDSGSAKTGGDAQSAHLCVGTLCPANPGAAGGTNACTGAQLLPAPGGAGGSGGEFQRSSDNLQWGPVSGEPTTAGNPTTVTTLSAGGGGIGIGGSNGANGINGKDGATHAFAFGANGFSASDGATGTDGEPGQSGGGAGGVYITSVSGLGNPTGNQFAWSEGGAGGGAGGCGGIAAQPGKGGGASVAIVTINSGFVLDHVTIETSTAGDGGAAGRPSDPTFGGSGGAAGQATKVAGYGGMGGRAGASANGGGGPSIGIAYQGTKPQLLASPITVGTAGHGVALRAFNDGTVIPASPDGTSSQDYAF